MKLHFYLHRLRYATPGELIARLKKFFNLYKLHLINRPNKSKSQLDINQVASSSIKIFSEEIDIGENTYSTYLNSNNPHPIGFPWLQKYKSETPIKLFYEVHKLYHLSRALLNENINSKVKIATLKEVETWISQNPAYHSLAWKSGLEVAIRGINLSFICLVCRPFLKEQNNSVIKILYDSINLLETNKSTHSSFGNHLIVELAGLCIISRTLYLLSEDNEFEERYRASFSELCETFNHQVNRDGGGVEGSLTYLILILECILFCALVLPKGRKELEIKSLEKIRKSLAFVEKIAGNSGEGMRFGDDDSASLFKFSDSADIECHERIQNLKFLAVHLELLDDKDKPIDSMYRDVLMAFDEKSNDSRKKHPPSKKQPEQKKNNDLLITNFEDSGVAVISCGSSRLIVHTDQKGLPPFYGHAHSDFGSINLMFEDYGVLVDPGSYCYTNQWHKRNLFRGEFHNTINSPELNQFLDIAAFIRKPVGKYSYDINQDKDSIEIEVIQNKQKSKFIWRRKILVETSGHQFKITIHDETNIVESKLKFLLGPNVMLSSAESNMIKYDISYAKLSVSSTSGCLKAGNGFYSPTFNKELEVNAIDVPVIDGKSEVSFCLDMER